MPRISISRFETTRQHSLRLRTIFLKHRDLTLLKYNPVVNHFEKIFKLCLRDIVFVTKKF